MTTKILVLASNPRDTAQLLLSREIRAIEDVIEKGKYREQFSLRRKDSVRVDDLQSSLQKASPRIVHFCGHGMGSRGLVLETNAGQRQFLDNQALSDLFRLFKHQIECVVLNACYSEVQAVEISKHINYVIGTPRSITDNAAIAFSTGFYQAVSNGYKIERAFEFGKNLIQLELGRGENPKRKLVPIITETGTETELPEPDVLKLLIKEPLAEILAVSKANTTMIDEAKTALARNITISKHSGSRAQVAGNTNITNTYNQTGNFGIGHMSGGTIESGAKVTGVITASSANNLEAIAQEIEKLLDCLEQNPSIKEAVAAIKAAQERQPKIDNVKIVTEVIQAQSTLSKRLATITNAGYIDTLKLLLPALGKALEDFKLAT